MAELNWTDAQWQNVNAAVAKVFREASVASAFLPMYGPLVGSAEIVRNERLQQDDTSTPPTISLDRDHPGVNLKLVNVTVNVELSTEQVVDETLSNAILAFRRAANILALEQDSIVFEGFRQNPRGTDSEFVVNNPDPERGLADLSARRRFSSLDIAGRTTGQAIVRAVVNASRRLEDQFNPAPFACVLGNTLFEEAHDPDRASLVLPADRIMPMLKGGPLLRSGKMDEDAGILVSLSGNAVDIVIGTPPTVQFLQRTGEAKFLFRVYEKFALRIRDAVNPPVAGFRIELNQQQRDDENRDLGLVNAENAATRISQEIKERS